MGCDVGNGVIQPWMSYDINVWYGETALGTTMVDYIYNNAGQAVDYKLINTEYYIFPGMVAYESLWHKGLRVMAPSV